MGILDWLAPHATNGQELDPYLKRRIAETGFAFGLGPFGIGPQAYGMQKLSGISRPGSSATPAIAPSRMIQPTYTSRDSNSWADSLSEYVPLSRVAPTPDPWAKPDLDPWATPTPAPRTTSVPLSTMGSRLINTIEPGGYESGMPMFDPSRIKPVDRAVILNNAAFPKEHFQYLLDAYESGATEEEIRASLVGTGVILPSDFFGATKPKTNGGTGGSDATGGGWNQPITEWERAFAQEHGGQSPVEAYGGGTVLPSGQYMSQGQAQAMAEFDRDWGANYASMHGKPPSQQEWENSYRHRLEMFYNNANPFGG